ncbi:hypothetical protein MLD38_019246 [Melastoma candidum]|uniref:Uncharacterized protein n=1 Tax=Melastoma candidum TaxID=119954 RepID=A0ACB9QWH4_9MYRT|nr:hypothetical protein MLD38_019246 [Melastoma candidum]
MSLRHLFLLWLCQPGTSRKYEALSCVGHSENATDRNYQNNLMWKVLQRRYINEGGLSYFYDGTVGGPLNTLYGLFLCRPDIAANECQSCIGSATTQILLSCPTQKRVMIWCDECQVQFSNQSFFTIMQTTPAIRIFDETNFIYPDLLEEVLVALLQNVMDSSISSNQLYATSHTNVQESLEAEARAQCTPDLLKPDGRSCLSAATDELRFPGTKVPLKWHISSAVAGAFFISIIFGLYICISRKMKRAAYRKNGKDIELLDLGNGFGGNIPSADFLGEKSMNSQDLVLMRLDSIWEATNNFSNESELGKGGFGPVYKGTLADGRNIAVKRLSRASGQGLEELKNEVTLITRLQHRNLVKLLGCCLEEQEKLLIYEYMPNKSLDFFLLGTRF